MKRLRRLWDWMRRRRRARDPDAAVMDAQQRLATLGTKAAVYRSPKPKHR